MSPVDFYPGPSEVHVWAVWITASDTVSHEFRAMLSSDEVARGRRFAFERLRRTHELSQGTLRLLLARYLNCHPRDIAFSFGPRGKPALQDNSRIRFNISHSGGLGLYSFTVDSEIGVDVEEVRNLPDIEQIAFHHFCPMETSQLSSIGDHALKTEAFFRCWTRKEAYIKAIGDGLYTPLDRFQVTLLPDEAARFVHIENDVTAGAEWTLQHLEPAPNYVGALAYCSRARKLTFHQPREAQRLLEELGR